MKLNSSLILSSLLAVLSSILVLKLFGPLPLAVNQTTTTKQGTFDVTGQSQQTAIPDEANIQIGVMSQASSVKQAQDELNLKMNQISQNLKSLNLEAKDIKTTQYTINPEYDYNNDRQRIVGYQASSQLQITLHELDKVSQVIDTATQNGANTVNGLSFNLSRNKKMELIKTARQEAIAEAKQNAEELAQLSGLRLGRIINVIESNPSSQPAPYMQSLKLDSAASETTQLEPGSQEYIYQITLSYETL